MSSPSDPSEKPADSAATPVEVTVDQPDVAPAEERVEGSGAPSPEKPATAAVTPPGPQLGTAEPAAPSAAGNRPSAALGIFLVFLLLLVFANGGVAYWLWQQQSGQVQQLQQVTQAQQQSAGLDDAVDQTRTGLTTVASDLDRTTQHFRQQMAALESELGAAKQSLTLLSDSNQQLRAKIEGGATAWRLDAVEQLLMTANERLLLAQDARSAEQALALADARLQAIADPAYIELRRVLAEEMASLRAMPVVDATAISLKLQALSDRAASLPLAGHLQRDHQRADRAPAESVATAVATAPWYQRLWQKTQEAVLSLVTIRQNTTPTAPLLPPDLHGLLVQNLRLQLAAARTALLLRDAAQYDSALRTAADWIQRYLGTEDASVQAAINTLAELRRVKISPTSPDISSSLRRLRQLREAG